MSERCAVPIELRADLRCVLLCAVVLLFSMAPMRASAAVVCERGKGYIAVDASQQLGEDFLRKIKAIGVNSVIRYYDWSNETLPGKTLTLQELRLIAKLEMSVAVVFQHYNDCLCTFMTKGRGVRDAKRALELARSFSQPVGSAIYFGVDGVDAQFLSLLRGTGIAGGDPEARKFVQRYVRSYFEEVAQTMKASGYKIGAYGSGLVCSHLLDARLVDYCWLANATSWPGYVEFEGRPQFQSCRGGRFWSVETQIILSNAAELALAAVGLAAAYDRYHRGADDLISQMHDRAASSSRPPERSRLRHAMAGAP
jgi:Domain of unknown function (DUF1906)